MNGNIELMAIECTKCHTEFFIMVKPQTVACPECGATAEAEILDAEE